MNASAADEPVAAATTAPSSTATDQPQQASYAKAMNPTTIVYPLVLTLAIGATVGLQGPSNYLKNSICALVKDVHLFFSAVGAGPLKLVAFLVHLPIALVAAMQSLVMSMLRLLPFIGSSIGTSTALQGGDEGDDDAANDDGAAPPSGRIPSRNFGRLALVSIGILADRAVVGTTAQPGGASSSLEQPRPIPWRHQPLFPQLAKAQSTAAAFAPPRTRPALRRRAAF